MTHSRVAHIAVGAAIAAAALVLSGCSTGSSDAGDSEGGDKLIVAVTGFDCGLNAFAGSLCQGFEDAAAELPEGITFQHIAGTDFSDQQQLTNNIETSLGLDPAGIIVFTPGPATQVPVLTRACDQGVKVFILDSDMPTLDCRTSLVATDNELAGKTAGEWLVDQDPVSKDVGIVGNAPGEIVSSDARVKGFTEVVEAAGFHIVSRLPADMDVEKTRSAVENMLEANPDLGAIFSLADFFGDGTSQALLASGRDDVLHISVDGNVPSVKRIPDGALDADVAQSPYNMGKLAVEKLAASVSGEQVDSNIVVPVLLVTQDNAAEYIKNDGRF